MLTVLDVPGVDMALTAGGEGKFLGCKPFQKLCCLFGLVVCVTAAGWGDRLWFGFGPQLGQQMPGGEAADDLRVVRIGNGGGVADQPALERADLFVDGGENTAGHEQLPQMRGAAPRFEGVECLVGQLDSSLAEFPEQVCRCPVLPLSEIEPGQARQWLVHGEQVFGEGNEFGPDLAAAVVE